MFNIGSCKVCRQGLLEIVKDESTNKIYICCDECEAEWENPEDAIKNINGTRGKYGRIIYPTQSEVNALNWNKVINEHHN